MPATTAEVSAATHSSLTFHCVADVETIISARSLTGLRWDIRFLGSQGTGELYVPGIRGCIPLSRGPKGEYLLMLVQDPRMPRGVFSIAAGSADVPLPGGLGRRLQHPGTGSRGRHA